MKPTPTLSPELRAIFDAGREERGKAPAPAPADLEIWEAADDVGQDIPPRGWLLGNTFCRKFVSSLIADGGTGKTALRIAQALSLATGRPLAGEYVFEKGNVLLVSFEDDADELRRRVRAAMQHYRIGADDIRGRLFLTTPGRVAGKLLELHPRTGKTQTGTLVALLEAAIIKHKLDLVILDPFVKTHSVPENENSLMDEVIQILANLANEHDIAVDIPHHTGKGRAATPGDADRSRGATAVKDGARLVYTLTSMSKEEAAKLGVDNPRGFTRVDSGKVNLVPQTAEAWFRLVSVGIGNRTALYPSGDFIQVAEPWTPPLALDGITDDIECTILAAIDAGIDAGKNLYSLSNTAKAGTRAWEVVQEHLPGKTEGQCKEVVKAWLKAGRLESVDYVNTHTRQARKGLKIPIRY